VFTANFEEKLKMHSSSNSKSTKHVPAPASLVSDAQKNNAVAQFKVGMHYYTQGALDHALRWFNKASNNRHAGARFMLAEMDFKKSMSNSGYCKKQPYELVILLEEKLFDNYVYIAKARARLQEIESSSHNNIQTSIASLR